MGREDQQVSSCALSGTPTGATRHAKSGFHPIRQRGARACADQRRVSHPEKAESTQKIALALLVPGVACAAAMVKGGLYGQAGAPLSRSTDFFVKRAGLLVHPRRMTKAATTRNTAPTIVMAFRPV